MSRAFAAREAPLHAVVDRLAPRHTGRPPVFQVLFAVQNNAPPRLELASARTSLLRQPYLDLPLELHTELWPAPDGGIRVDVTFRPDVVDRTVAAEISARFTDRMNEFPGFGGVEILGARQRPSTFGPDGLERSAVCAPGSRTLAGRVSRSARNP